MGRVGRLDSADRSARHGRGDAGLPARGRTGHRAFDEPGTAGPLRRLFRRLGGGACNMTNRSNVMAKINPAAEKMRPMVPETLCRLRKPNPAYDMQDALKMQSEFF